MTRKPAHSVAAAATALVLAMTAHAAQAQQVVVDTMNFQGVNATATQSGNEVLNYYNGGISQVGTTGGSALDFGVAFGTGGVADSVQASSANFTANPSASNDVLFFKAGSTTSTGAMNVAGGFTSLSFNYSSQAGSGDTGTASVSLYTGLNGTGSLIETITLSDNTGTSFGCSATKAYCKWTETTTTLGTGQIAESAVFSGATGYTYFDSVSVAAVVPEPSTWALMAAGLLIVGAATHTRRRSEQMS